MKKSFIFFTTFEKKREADTFAKKIIKLRRAACVNVFPTITSHYIWKNKQHRAQEVLVMGKTTDKGIAWLKRNIKELHPYELPEFIAFEISDGLPDYLKWISHS